MRCLFGRGVYASELPLLPTAPIPVSFFLCNLRNLWIHLLRITAASEPSRRPLELKFL